MARWLADGADHPVTPLTATSRAPGSRLNGAARRLSPDLTSGLEIGAGADDRGRVVVSAAIVAGTRGGRKAIDAVALDGGWVRRRSSTTSQVRWTAAPDADRHLTAARVSATVDDLLSRAAWPLDAWALTAP
ncbi:MAG: hypothetical protein WEB09_02225 [Nitriliruptor sp.]